MPATIQQTLYNNVSETQIDPTSDSNITTTNFNANHTAIVGNIGQDLAVGLTYIYQDQLKLDVAKSESINRDINDQLNYTMMAMTIWVPLGILAGYYLYKKNVGFTAPGVK